LEWMYRGVFQPYRIKKWGQLLKFVRFFLNDIRHHFKRRKAI
jgi:UDP-N-acetyl-D-mannosaminuronic acid transferase (WecB/TagA/CpsF family)